MCVQLDKQSTDLTEFCSPTGQRYRFKRLPFGIKVAQDVFQEKIDTELANCEGFIYIADDIVVFGKDEAEFEQNIHKLMRVAKQFGIVFNPEKCQIGTKEIKFFGMVYSMKGIKPDQDKTQEIADLPSPQRVKELQQFLGMIQYVAPFIPKLSEQTSVLRDLIKKDKMWVWTPTHQDAYEKLKNQVCNTVSLQYFNPKLQTKVQVDASKHGLGAALIQITDNNEERIIAFASKALTETEMRYANIESVSSCFWN